LRIALIICLSFTANALFSQLTQLSEDDLILEQYNWILVEDKNLECKPAADDFEDTKVENCKFIDAFEIFPNPTNSKVTITFNAHKEETSIMINTLDGRRIFSEELIDFDGKYNKTIELNTEGILIVTVMQRNEVFTKKLVVQ